MVAIVDKRERKAKACQMLRIEVGPNEHLVFAETMERNQIIVSIEHGESFKRVWLNKEQWSFIMDLKYRLVIDDPPETKSEVDSS